MGGAVKALSAAVEDKLGGTIRIFLDLVVPQPDDRPAMLLQKCGPIVIISGRSFSMLATVQFDGELRISASEIDDVWFDDELAGEARAVPAKPQPQQALGFC